MAARTLWECRGVVRETKPSASPSQVNNWLNRRIQNVLDTRTWSDVFKRSMIVIPAATTSGVVNMTPGSALVAGSGTSWPVSDQINTISVNPITDSPGFVEIQPGAGVMAKIQPGMFLLIDQENASVTEVLTVVSAGPISFVAYCQYAHDASVTLKQSSLAGLQFSTDAYVYTVQAVLSTTSLQLDMPYGGLTQTGVSYMIRKEYVQISPTAKYVKYAYDAIAGQTIGVDKDDTWAINLDPQDQSTGNPLELLKMTASPGGVAQWRVYPYQTSQYAIAVLYVDGWPMLRYDTDLMPPFINSEVFIAGAISDALRTKCIKRAGERDDWFMPQEAMVWEQEFGRLLENATQSDQGRRTNYISNYLEDLKSYSYNWLRGHAVSAAGSGWAI